jgi:hypothetical protein
LAQQAQIDALATQSVVQATATVARAEQAAQAQATQQASAASTAQAASATQTASTQLLQQQSAQTAQAWLDICTAAVQITAMYEATLIATQTASIEDAQKMAHQSGHYNPYGAIHDGSAAISACQKQRGAP